MRAASLRGCVKHPAAPGRLNPGLILSFNFLGVLIMFTQVNQEQWADHCSNFNTYCRAMNYPAPNPSFMECVISREPDKPWQKPGRVGAIVGRVEYRCDGSILYFIA